MPAIAKVLAIACIAILTSCSSPTERPPAPSAPPAPWTGQTADLSMVWSADPGIDLVTGPAVVLRAYMESYALVRNMDDIAVAYPGFTRAVTRTAEQHNGDPWPGKSPLKLGALAGTLRYHILRIQHSGEQVTSYVCDYSGFTSSRQQEDGTYGFPPDSGPVYDGIAALRLIMGAPTSSSSPLPPQRGPAPAPVTDVFGAWRITESRAALFLNEWPTAAQDKQSCRDRSPLPLDRRKFLLQGPHPRSDYPTLPFYPGWPPAGPA